MRKDPGRRSDAELRAEPLVVCGGLQAGPWRRALVLSCTRAEWSLHHVGREEGWAKANAPNSLPSWQDLVDFPEQCFPFG